MNLIGLSGIASSGKSTVARILAEDHGFVEVNLADPMKRACAEWFGWDVETLWGPSSKRNEPDKRYPRFKGNLDTPAQALAQWPLYLTPRHALQQLGTQFGRACYENVWVDIAIAAAKAILGPVDAGYSPSGGLCFEMSSHAKGVCIADCRFPNEVEAIRAAGGKVWRVLRPQKSKSVLRREGAMQGLSIDEVLKQEAAWRAHSSETALDDWGNERFDAVLNNGGSLEMLRTLVRGVYTGDWPKGPQ